MFQFQFHWYGFFIGLAAIVGFSLVEFQAKKRHVPMDFFWKVIGWVFVSGLVGSRAWHVMTDFHLYATQLVNVFAIWNGGLSIIGSIAGALVGFWLFFVFHPQWKKYQLLLLDLSVFGLPIAQAIGRFGNYANQELYGLPTNLFWSIKIDLAHRLPGFEQFSTFHPLFAYEAILLTLFTIVIWWKEKKLPIGSGRVFVYYVVFYSWVRFSLDFLRIDKATSFVAGLGFNQVVLLGVAILTTFYLFFQKNEQKKL